MALSQRAYHLKIEECLTRADQRDGDAAAIWRALANTYWLLIVADEQQTALNSALIRPR